MICFDTLPPEHLLHGHVLVLITQPDKEHIFQGQILSSILSASISRAQEHRAA